MAAESLTDTEDKSKRWSKHAVWMGLAITLAGSLSSFGYFAQFPELRDFPVVNLPLVWVGMLLCAAASV